MAIGFQGKFALLLSDRSEFIKINRDGGKRYRLDTTDEVESWNDSFFVDVVRSWPDGRREVVLFSFDTDRSQTLVVVRDAEGRFHGMGTDERPTFLLVPIVGTWSKARGYERPWEGRGRFWLKWAADDTWVVRKGDYFVSQGGDERPDAMQVVRVGMALPGIGVGELEDGEVALYAEPHYGGRAWVLNADTPDFRRLPGMKDAVRSVRVGPRAAVSLFDQPAWSGKFQLEVDEDMPALPAGIDHNALSAKVWLNPGVQALPKVGEIAVYAQPGFIGSGRILPALPTGLFDATILFRAVGFGSVQLGPGMALSLIGSGPRHVVYSSIEDVNDGLPFPVASTEQLNIFFQSQSPRFEGPWALRTTTAAHARYLSSAGEVPRGRATAGAAEALRLRPGTSGPPSEVSILAPDGRVLHWRGPANLELVFQATPNVFPIFDLHVEGPGRWAIGLDRPAPQRWITYDPAADRFSLTTDPRRREVFVPVGLAADQNAGLPPPGTVMLFEHPNFWGRAWVLAGDVDLRSIEGFPEKPGSARPAASTGATLLAAGDPKAEPRALLRPVSRIEGSEVDGPIRAIRVFSVPDPLDLPFVVDGQAMEIYVAAAGAPAGVKTPPPEQKLALRVALRPRKGMSLLPGTEITIGASDAIRFFHGDRSIALARGETVRLPLGELGRLALDIPAVDFITPALTLRTDDMPPDQLAVVHPDEPLHCYLAGLRARDVEGLLSEDMVKAVRDYAQMVRHNDHLGPDNPRAPMACLSFTPRAIRTGESMERPIAAPPGGGFAIEFREGVQTLRALTPADRAAAAAPADQPQPTLRQLIADVLANRERIVMCVATAASDALNAVSQVADDVTHRVRLAVDAARDGITRAFRYVITTVEDVFLAISLLLATVRVEAVKLIERAVARFDWDAILDTQAAIRAEVMSGLGQVRGAFGSLTSAIEAALMTAKSRAPAAFDGIRDSTIDKSTGSEMNRPEYLRQPIVDLTDSPQASWMLGRLGDSANLVTIAQVTPDRDGEAAFRARIDAFQAWMGAAVDPARSPEARTTFDAIDGAIGGPVAQGPPTAWPLDLDALLARLRGAVDYGVEVGKGALVRALDLVDYGTHTFEQLLDAEVTVPLLSRLWHDKTEGSRLTLLDLITWLVAAPVTISFQLLHPGTRPFERAALVARDGGAAAGLGLRPTVDYIWDYIYSVLLAISGILDAVLDGTKDKKWDTGATITSVTSLVLKVTALVFTPPGEGLDLGKRIGGAIDAMTEYDFPESWPALVWWYEWMIILVEVVVGVFGYLFTGSGFRPLRRFGDVGAWLASALAFILFVLLAVVIAIALVSLELAEAAWDFAEFVTLSVPGMLKWRSRNRVEQIELAIIDGVGFLGSALIHFFRSVELDAARPALPEST